MTVSLTLSNLGGDEYRSKNIRCLKFNQNNESFAFAMKINKYLPSYSKIHVYCKDNKNNFEFDYELIECKELITDLDYSPCGNYLAFACTDTFIVNIYSVDKLNTSTFKTQVAKLTGHNDFINSVRFSPSGYFIVTGSKDKFIFVYA